MANRAAIYVRVAFECSAESQLSVLQQAAAERQLYVVKVYRDDVCNPRARRRALDDLMADAHRRAFDVILVADCSRLARDIPNLLGMMQEFYGLGIGFIAANDRLDTTGADGNAVIATITTIQRLEKSLNSERIRFGMQAAKLLEGRSLGRRRADVNRDEIVKDRLSGLSLGIVAKKHGVSRAMVCVLAREAQKHDSQVPSSEEPYR